MTLKLTLSQVQQHINTSIPKWTFDPESHSLKRSLRFGSFPEALGFMVTVGVEAQQRDHHPEWFNVYDRVDIVWRTHDCGGVSEKDVEMAKRCDDIYSKYEQG